MGGGHLLYVQLLSNNSFELFCLILLEIDFRSQKDFERNLMSKEKVNGTNVTWIWIKLVEGWTYF